MILPPPVTAKLLAAAVLPGRHLAGGGWCGDTLALSAPLDTTTVTNIITLKHCVLFLAPCPHSVVLVFCGTVQANYVLAPQLSSWHSIHPRVEIGNYTHHLQGRPCSDIYANPHPFGYPVLNFWSILTENGIFTNDFGNLFQVINTLPESPVAIISLDSNWKQGTWCSVCTEYGRGFILLPPSNTFCTTCNFVFLMHREQSRAPHQYLLSNTHKVAPNTAWKGKFYSFFLIISPHRQRPAQFLW